MCDSCGCGQAAAARSRTVLIEERVLAKNDAIAAAIRHMLAQRGVLMINLLGSPGSGKTMLLEKSLPLLMQTLKVAVLEGDVQTRYDAERLRKAGVPAVQINTGGACHLDAESVHRALADEPFLSAQVIVIENVGNLVCPSMFDLGEDAKVVALSVAEGEDKPEKYPSAFASASAMLITKTDLIPHLSFDLARCRESARQVHPGIPIMPLSAVSGDGMDAWLQWLRHQRDHKSGVPHGHGDGAPPGPHAH
jgi:hydrogenase nickel incorporation protein HypB